MTHESSPGAGGSRLIYRPCLRGKGRRKRRFHMQKTFRRRRRLLPSPSSSYHGNPLRTATATTSEATSAAAYKTKKVGPAAAAVQCAAIPAIVPHAIAFSQLRSTNPFSARRRRSFQMEPVLLEKFLHNLQQCVCVCVCATPSTAAAVALMAALYRCRLVPN